MPSPHADVGLQPERTLLAWRRTLLSMLAVSSLFLRWVPYHGAFAFGLVAVALLAVAAMWLGQWRRYRLSSQGINDNRLSAALGEVAALSLTCAVLGALGLYVVLRF